MNSFKFSVKLSSSFFVLLLVWVAGHPGGAFGMEGHGAARPSDASPTHAQGVRQNQQADENTLRLILDEETRYLEKNNLSLYEMSPEQLLAAKERVNAAFARYNWDMDLLLKVQIAAIQGGTIGSPLFALAMEAPTQHMDPDQAAQHFADIFGKIRDAGGSIEGDDNSPDIYVRALSTVLRSHSDHFQSKNPSEGVVALREVLSKFYLGLGPRSSAVRDGVKKAHALELGAMAGDARAYKTASDIVSVAKDEPKVNTGSGRFWKDHFPHVMRNFKQTWNNGGRLPSLPPNHVGSARSIVEDYAHLGEE